MPAPSRPLAILWTNETKTYRNALEHAGLASRLDIRIARQGETPPEDVLAAAEMILA